MEASADDTTKIRCYLTIIRSLTLDRNSKRRRDDKFCMVYAHKHPILLPEASLPRK